MKIKLVGPKKINACPMHRGSLPTGAQTGERFSG